MADSAPTPAAGAFVHVRTRNWLVGSIATERTARARLACIDDDAQGKILEIIWGEELDARILITVTLRSLTGPAPTTR
jgi:hypothetical protein